ncbi:hypothetical protein PYW07_008650 [Mythimna separata]|uniref:Uncharacterized protein n=1 Tax=Mythimna separata TaxID=271217 RepID=A0AAD8DNW2_MYTSE|nr:hypothetical protein PYW07_008650 [Mythimna separata]
MTPTPQEHATPQEIPTEVDGERVVISGMSGLYPDSNSIKDLSDILYNKVNPVSKEALRFQYHHPEVVQYSGTVPGLSYFDAQFFKVHYRLANCMDPMGRKILEQSYQAIYDAGVNPEELSGKKVGVYIGTCFSEAEKACFYEAANRSGFGIAGCSKTMFANRISYWLNAKGPSMSIDMACCSSTAALEQAYLALSRGECEAAIVGGAYLCLHPQSSVHYGRLMNLCQDGKTKSFDEHADGCAKSEAINVLFLQKAKNALRIYADVLYAKSEYTCILPGETGPQYGFYRDFSKTVNFIKNFYEEARIPTRAIEYVEACGCAVPEADKVELQTIEEVFCNDRESPLMVGSVMSNIGYNEAASGITAITKVLLGYHTGQLAANLHCNNPRQDVVALREGRIRVITEHQPFDRSYVAVNGMSVTGVNSHVLLHGHYKPKDPNRYKSSIAHLVTISARHEAAVTHCLGELKANPIDPEQLRLLHNIHQTNISGHMARGFVILQTNEEQKTVCLSEKAEYFDDARRPLWFVYSGMGSQWAGMGTQLMRIPIFAAAIQRCHKVLEPRGLNIVDIITSPDEKFDNILHSFVGIAAIQIGLTDILKELGLVPDGIIGHSVGELGCAYADGCLSAEEMILAAYSRGRVSLETKFIRGSMAAIGLGYEQILPLCPPEIEVACHNGPESSTISGPAEVMKEFVSELTAKGIFAKEVPCSNIAYHSRYIADAGPLLLKYLSEVIKDPKPRTERWISTSVPEEKWNEPIAKYCSAEYQTNNLLSPVLFEETSRLIPNNAVCVEVAPHGLLQAILKRSLHSNCKNIALTKRMHADNTLLLLEAIGKLFMEGFNPKVHILYPKVELPVSTGTPFLSHLVHWAHGEKWPMPMYRTANRTTASALDYVLSVQDTEHAYLQGHCMRGQNLYPYAASLVLVWDTFAMALGHQKKELSVQFSNIHLYAQPVIHDQRQISINVVFHRGNGNFEILNEGSKVATGYINVLKDVENTKQRELTETPETEVSIDLTSEDIYYLLRDRDYAYSGEFLSLEGANKSLSEASLVWRDNWVTFVDGLLQLDMLRQPHDGVSQVAFIRDMTINIKSHEEIVQKSYMLDHKVSLKAVHNSGISRCGGVTISNVKLENLPPLSNKNMALQALKFVPYFQSDIDVATSLQVYLQTVAENVNKENINVIGLVNTKGDIFTEINNVTRNILGLNVKYEEVSRESALKKQNNFLKGVDLVLVQNLSTDDDICQLLHRFLQKDQFVASVEDLSISDRLRPNSLYRIVSAHSIVQNGNKEHSKLLLARWGASAAVPTTTVTVRTNSDILLLITTRNNLSAGHRLLIIAPYPEISGLKELVSHWRREANRNKIHLIMVSKNSNDNFYNDDIPDIDLAFNVMNNGKWGGEYYLPVEDSTIVSKNVSLQCNQFGDLDSLTWIEAPALSGFGVPVKVQYAGLSYDDVKKANGSLLHKLNIKNSFGMEFSGTTASGSRVMGLVRTGAAGSVVLAQPELLWPVPSNWSLEDAATVPLAYIHAFYCFVMKTRIFFTPETSVLVHGGAGAFGQAVISIALSQGFDVFTTVSDMQKKHFLQKLFPELKADHIGNSRDPSFSDTVLSKTQGGCTVVISGLGKDLKKSSINCTKEHGWFVDVSQLHNQDDFAYGMYSLTKERSYTAVDISSIFEPEYKEDARLLQSMLSDGISRGYVRPLSRISYAPHDVVRAFRLLAASKHRGRVLLRMEEAIQEVQARLSCKADRTHVILCNGKTFGLQLGDKLVERGARKLAVHSMNQSMSYLQLQIRSWQRQGVEVAVFSNNLSLEANVNTLLSNASHFGPIEGVYVTVGDKQKDTDEALLNILDMASRKLCKDIKYFAVLNTGDNIIGKEVCLRRISNNLPATILSLPELSQESCNIGAWKRGAVDVTEKALRGAHNIVLARTTPTQQTSLLQEVIALADVTTTAETDKYTTLAELGVASHKIPLIYNHLRINYNVVIEEKEIPLITLDTLKQLEKSIFKTKFQDSKGLSTFFTFVDSDELLATTDFVCMPTLINNASMRDDEFDSSQTYLSIIPGMEGHHERFRVLCDRLKLPALVLQLGFDHPTETIQETAERLAEVFLKKTGLKNHFYLLGYESGIFVALEMAAILESHGLTGTVFCVGYAPDEFDVHLEEQLAEYETEEQLQDAVVRHMFTLMVGGDTTGLDNALQTASTWSAKVDVCVRTLLGRVSHSAQYARGLLETTLRRVERVRGYVPRVHALRSQLVLLRPASPHPAPSPLNLQCHSLRPVIVHQLSAPLVNAPTDLKCAVIVNTYLDPTILENFNKKNICNTYLMNAGSFIVQLSHRAEKEKVAFKDQIARSISHVSEILMDVEDKIGREREVLSQIDDKLKETKNVTKKVTKKESKEEESDLDYGIDINWNGTSKSDGSGKYGNYSYTIKTTPSLYPTPKPTSTYGTPPVNWHLSTTVKGTDQADTLYIQDLKKNMVTKHYGYFTAFLDEFSELIFSKNQSDAYTISTFLMILFKKDLNENRFRSVGDDLLGTFRLVLIWFESLSAARIQQQAGVFHHIIPVRDKSLSKDINNLIDYYDNMFTKAQGQKLFEALERLFVYPQANVSLMTVGKSLYLSALGPYIASEGTVQQKRLVQLMLMGAHDINPFFRAQYNANKYSKETDITETYIPQRRSMNYKKFANHLLSNHRTLFKKLKRHYKHDKKKKHHRGTHKQKHRHSYGKNGDRHHRHEREQIKQRALESNEKLQNEEIEESSYIVRAHHGKTVDRHDGHGRIHEREQIKRKADMESNEKLQSEEIDNSSTYYGENFKSHQQKNPPHAQFTEKLYDKQKKIKSEPKQRKHDKKPKTSAQSIIQPSDEDQVYPHYLKQPANRIRDRRFNSLSGEDIFNHSKDYKNSKENKKLNKIIEASSYSDEENHLKMNLYDALRHGNETFVSFRKSNGDTITKQTLLHLSSEADEEWILKKNIYKFFE